MFAYQSDRHPPTGVWLWFFGPLPAAFGQSNTPEEISVGCTAEGLISLLIGGKPDKREYDCE
jgi:hypothetical protein